MLRLCHTDPPPSVMVWVGIGYTSQSPLIRINGTLNSTGYISDVVRVTKYTKRYYEVGTSAAYCSPIGRRRFVEWAQNEIAVVPDFHKRILFSDEAHFWLNGYVNKQNCRIWSEANPQVYVETPLHQEKLTVWCAL
ncbi:hypothetical protein TNCV_4936551 [Trichonephila clavipes]|nr:hypothetical protein TNCV_4936551 [Trichonephila clavipes]